MADLGLHADGHRPHGRLAHYQASDNFAAAVKTGFAKRPYSLPCRYFYDVRGFGLFSRICTLPEYYLTRAESEILRLGAHEILENAGIPETIIEWGSGDSSKARLLLSSLMRRRDRARYVPVDFSHDTLAHAEVTLSKSFSRLTINPLCTEYRHALKLLSTLPLPHPRLFLWLGSCIGNMEDADAVSFLSEVAAFMSEDDRFLIGFDRRKEKSVMEAAYNDRAGVTAAFNRNMIGRINRELGGRFGPNNFEHVAWFNKERSRIEMHLRAAVSMSVPIPGAGVHLGINRGELIQTEISRKYLLEDIEILSESAGLLVDSMWNDAEGLFTLALLRTAEEPVITRL